MPKTLGYAASDPKAKLAPFTFERRDPGPHDVAIDILYTGVCHSDIHTARNEWGGTLYPSVPGHEIVGRVSAVGAHVTRFKAGDLVGVGCMVDSCRTCASCTDGFEQYCEGPHGFTGTYNGAMKGGQDNTFGGYSDKIVVTEHFVLKVPENLDAKAVAPLLCAGITTYSPLRHWDVQAGDKVAVVGLGGLGHMAIKLAKAMGAEVSVFTTSPAKKADAERLGADHVIISKNADEMAAAAFRFDLIVDTVPTKHNVDPYVATLKRDGTLVIVGAVEPLEPMNGAQVILFRRSVAGSLIGGIAETQEMLDFCGKHNVVSDIEMIRMDQINEAYERMLKSDVKYRFVIDIATLKDAA